MQELILQPSEILNRQAALTNPASADLDIGADKASLSTGDIAFLSTGVDTG